MVYYFNFSNQISLLFALYWKHFFAQKEIYLRMKLIKNTNLEKNVSFMTIFSYSNKFLSLTLTQKKNVDIERLSGKWISDQTATALLMIEMA